MTVYHWPRQYSMVWKKSLNTAFTCSLWCSAVPSIIHCFVTTKQKTFFFFFHQNLAGI